MEKGRQSLFGTDTERQFIDDRLAKQRRRHEEKRGVKFEEELGVQFGEKYEDEYELELEDKIKNIARREAQKQIRKHEELKRKERKSRFILLGVSLIIMILTAFFLENPSTRETVEKIKNLGLISDIMAGAFAIFCEFFKEEKSQKSANGNSKPGGATEIVNFLQAGFRRCVQSKGVRVIMLFGVFIIAGGWMAEHNVVHRGISLFRGEAQTILAGGGGKEDVLLAEGETAVVTMEMKKELTEGDESLIQQLDSMKVTQGQRKLEMNLSPEDYDIVFPEESGGDAFSQERLNQAVLQDVRGLASHHQENVFDKPEEQGGAPQGLKDDIHWVSVGEENAKTFEEVNDRVNFREDTNMQYPKKTLVQLIANDYQNLALLLVWYGGNKNTIVYFYGQSIINDLKYLEYAGNSDKTIKDKLLIIAQRYKDIAYVCPELEEAENARRLEAAFRYAASQY